MNYQYKIIVSNRMIYREFEIPNDVDDVRLGTMSGCEFRLDAGDFFRDITLELERSEDEWEISASEGIYLSRGDMRKLMTMELKHGDLFSVHYADTDDEVFGVRFQIDFEARIPNYNWKISLRDKNKWVISDDISADLLIDSSFSRNNKMALVQQKNGWGLNPINSQFGVYVNGSAITQIQELHDYDFFSVSEFFFFYKNGEIYFDSYHISVKNGKVLELQTKKNDFQYPLFIRNARLKERLGTEDIPLLDPPQAPMKPEQNIVMTLMPAIVMMALTVLIRGVMSSTGSSYILFSVCSMGMGIVTSIIGFISGEKKYKEDVKSRQEQYNDYIRKKTDEIIEERESEKKILNDMYYDARQEVQMVHDFSTHLFDREVTDDDFLDLYLGKGQVIATRKIDYKKQENFATDDVLATIPEQIEQEYRYLNDVPIVLHLRDCNAVGVVGTKEVNNGFFRNVVLDLSTRQYYGDLEIAVLISDDYESMKWLRLLPDVNGMFGIRNIVCDNDSKTNLFEAIYKELLRRQENPQISGKQLVILVMEERGLKNHPLSRFIKNAAALKCTFIFFEQCQERVPIYCEQIIRLYGNEQGELQLCEDATSVTRFTYQSISEKDMQFVARRLAPVYCEEISLESALRKNYTLFEMLGIYAPDDWNLEKAWSDSKIYESMAAPLGINAKNDIVSLNLHEKAHGPHGLVAGTTGSGKSEILQSYILSAALKFHPYEIGFVIIDFKGGGMVNQFRDLPHLIGAITNIDGREIDRSLKSIKAELVKRQTLFAQADVNHIDKYIKLYKEKKVDVALPHLVIIVDEFAELKAEQPEFMKELISAARIGRSLGVHLILATQKPAGQVNEQIWSNSKFKLCLKVQNQEDSKEVLKSPLAAEIKEPGRAYLQVGNNEIFELFQSAYSGGPASVESGNSEKKFVVNEVSFTGYRKCVFEQKQKKTGAKADTELEAIVKYIANYCETNGIERLPGICLPPLEDNYTYDCASKVQNDRSAILVPIGIFDDPDNQRQAQVNLNVSETNTFILGSSQFGKTCMLQTVIRGLAENYTPQEVQIYILDFASLALKVFDVLKHVGGVVVTGESDKMKLFFKMMEKEIKERKNRFSEMGITSYQSYRETGKTEYPQIVILLDNIIAFRELCDEYNDNLLNICREGVAVGITIIATAQQTTGLGYKYLSTFGNKYGLVCNEKSEYSTIFDRCRMEPKSVPGRALTEIDKVIYEFQSYLAFEGEKEIERVEDIKRFITRRNGEVGNLVARRIPEIPKVLTNQYMSNTYGKIHMGKPYLGIDYETVEPVCFELMREGYMAIAGKEGHGRSNFIKNIFALMQSNIFDFAVEAYVIDSIDKRLEELQEYVFVENYTMDVSYFETILDKIEHACEMRLEKMSAGLLKLDEEPLLIVVLNNVSIYDTSKISKEIGLRWREILKKYKMMKVLFVLSAIENETIGITSSELLKQVKDTKNILYFDELSTLKIADVPMAVQRQFRQTMEVGDAFWLSRSEVTRLKTPIYEEV